MWINLFNTEIQSFFGGKKYVAFYSSQQTSFSSTSIIPVSGLTSQASYLSHYFFPGKEKKQVHRYSLLFAMTAGSIFVPAGNPHPLQPECFSPECQASTYWWTWDRTASEAASKIAHIGQSHAALLQWPQQTALCQRAHRLQTPWTRRAGKQENPNALPKPQRGPSAFPATAQMDSCSSLYPLPPSFSHASLSAKLFFLPTSWWIYFWCVRLSWPGLACSCNKPSPRKPFSSLEFLKSVG